MKINPKKIIDVMISLLFAAWCIVMFMWLSGCQSPRTSYTNGVIFGSNGSMLWLGYGEYIEVAPGGKLDRSIKGESDTLTLKIDNGEVTAKDACKCGDR